MQKEFSKDFFLWRRFKGGDDTAFFDMYEQHVDSLFSFGMQFSNDPDFIKDCIHDLFLDLYKYKKSLKDTDSIRFYLLKALRRRIYKAQKANAQWGIGRNEGIEEALPTDSFEELLIRAEIEQENLEVLNKALSGLTEQQQKTLSLKYEHNLSYPEIATLLDISIESARTNIYRALKSLRENIFATDPRL